ncbi:MAG: phytanoyl-CoA dioxygenase family protein [Candidatus Poribacteria bacterium]|nr:phytanoyl-CoA dioxygenase family protein [Candidatus Poribacteria bacterium]
MLDATCLQHRLTEAERLEFEERGTITVEDAIPPEMIDRLTEVTDRIWHEQREAGLGPHDNLFYPNFVAKDDAYVELVDWHTTFPKVWDILSWNVQLYHSHLGVTPRVAPGTAHKTRLGWHQDSGRVNTEMESTPRPRLSLKIGYFLSDVSELGRGNFYVIPGSHKWDKLGLPSDGESNPEEAIPVCVKPGTAVFFDRRLWHARSENYSDVTRKVLFYGYSYRWLRTKDDMTIPPALMERSDPIRRQLLGDGINANGHFSPTDGDVPLRGWLKEHLGEEAVS